MPWKWDGEGNLIETKERVPPWKYDPVKNREKHKWPKDEAGFDPPDVPGSPGKCPSSITNVPGLAEHLLREGVPWPIGADDPKQIYNVYQGVVYRANYSVLGRIYHGFPEREYHARKVPDEVLEVLAERADKAGDYQKFKNWARTYLPNGWKSLKYKARHD